MKDPGAGDLWAQDGVQGVIGQVLKRVESGESGGMDNAAQRGERSLDSGEESSHGRLIGDVGPDGQDLSAELSQSIEVLV